MIVGPPKTLIGTLHPDDEVELIIADGDEREQARAAAGGPMAIRRIASITMKGAEFDRWLLDMIQWRRETRQ